MKIVVTRIVSYFIRSDSALGHTDSEDDQASKPRDGHLDGIEDGCSCSEVWEHLSEQRDGSADG
jgi:hypothetical protein